MIEEMPVIEFCLIGHVSAKEHIHVIYADGTFSTSLCGNAPQFIVRKHHAHALRNLSARVICGNCRAVYNQIRKKDFTEEHPVMKRLLDREMMLD